MSFSEPNPVFFDRCFVIPVILAFCVLVAPYLAPNDPAGFSLANRLQSISFDYPLGTDHMGRCVLSRLLHGFRVTLLAALAIVSVAAAIGSYIGILSGYFGGWLDRFLMRIVEGVFIFPAIAVALTISALLGLGMWSVLISLAAVHWAEYARVMRNLTIAEKEQPYITAIKTIGAKSGYIMLRHILPNVLHAILVLIPYSLSWAILSFSGLSYLGLGAEPGSPEWGLMIAEGRTHMRDHPNLVIAPGLLIICVIIAMNIAGDSLRDRLSPFTQETLQ